MQAPLHNPDDSKDFDNLPSFLKAGKREDMYNIPEGYFEELPGRILSEIMLSEIKKGEETVPLDYFDELTADIQSNITLEKLSISKEPPFQVPADYFEWLPAQIQEKALKQPHLRFSFAWLRPRFLAPAAFAAIVILIGIRFLSPDHSKMEAATLSEQERKEVLENPEAFGFDESIVMEHVAGRNKASEKNTVASEQNEAIDYLIENNVDPNIFPADN